MTTRTGEGMRWGDHSRGEEKEGAGSCRGELPRPEGRRESWGHSGPWDYPLPVMLALGEVGAMQAGEASPLSTWHRSTVRWSQVGA